MATSTIPNTVSSNNFYTRTVNSITKDSNRTLLQLGVITGIGVFMIALTSTLESNTGSLYLLRYNYSGTGAYYITPVYEGSAVNAPRINSNGILRTNTGTNETTVRIIVIKMDV